MIIDCEVKKFNTKKLILLFSVMLISFIGLDESILALIPIVLTAFFISYHMVISKTLFLYKMEEGSIEITDDKIKLPKWRYEVSVSEINYIGNNHHDHLVFFLFGLSNSIFLDSKNKQVLFERLSTLSDDEAGYEVRNNSMDAYKNVVTTNPVLTVLIMILLCWGFFFQVLHTEPFSLETLISLGGNNKELVLLQGEYYRLLIANFLHINPAHFLFNLFVFIYFSSKLEGLLGKKSLFFLCVSSAIGGAFMAAIFQFEEVSVSVGFSTVIYGFLGAFLTLNIINKKLYQVNISISYFEIIIYLLVPFIMTRFTDLPIDHTAHLGGFLFGIFSMLLSKARVSKLAQFLS